MRDSLTELLRRNCTRAVCKLLLYFCTFAKLSREVCLKAFEAVEYGVGPAASSQFL